MGILSGIRQLGLIGEAICKQFQYFHRPTTAFVRKKMPNATATGGGEKTQLSVAGFSAQKCQHGPQFSVTRPIDFGHGSFLPQDQIDHPAATYMMATVATVIEDVVIRAASGSQGMSQFWQPLE